MRRIPAAFLAAAGVALTAAAAPALMIAFTPPAQRALTADVVVVGKVTAVEKETVEATPFPGSPQKVQYKVAVVKIETNLAGAANLAHIKVGFVPAPPVAPPVVGEKPLLRPILPRRGMMAPELKEGQEFLLFLVKHPDAGFYVMPNMSPPLATTGEDAKQEVEAIKKTLAVTADPAKALAAASAADRYFAAATLVTKYRAYPPAGGEVGQAALPAAESKLILTGLAEGDWTKFEPGIPSGMQAFYSLGLTDKDGWVAPKPTPVRPGQPPVNFNQVTKDAFVTWLAGPGKAYQIQRVVPKAK